MADQMRKVGILLAIYFSFMLSASAQETYCREGPENGRFGLYHPSDPETNLLARYTTKPECVDQASGNFYCREGPENGRFGLYHPSDPETNLLARYTTKPECVERLLRTR